MGDILEQIDGQLVFGQEPEAIAKIVKVHRFIFEFSKENEGSFFIITKILLALNGLCINCVMV